MATKTPSKRQLRLVNLSFVLLFLLAIGLLHFVSREYKWQFDWTQNGRHSLSGATQAVLKQLNDPLKVTAFASQRNELRRQISDFFARYQNYKSDIQLEFIDPDADPEKVRAAGVQYDGEVVLAYGASRETLPPNRLTEENVSLALTRLSHRGERWLVFLSGHGEGAPGGNRNFDYGLLSAELNKRGFKTRALALAETPQIPANTTALVIGGSRAKFLPGEIKEIERFLKEGGNLLWLHPPGPMHGLDKVAEWLGLEFMPGVIVDPASNTLTGHPTAVVLAKYGSHPVVKQFTELTLFPLAGGIRLSNATDAPEKSAKAKNPVDGFQSQVILDTRSSSWAETGALNNAVRFDAGQDIKGPLNIAVSFSREVETVEGGKRQQRVVVTGDSDFLTNAYLGNAGNLDFGLSLTNWLSQDDSLVSIPARTARDKTLNLSRHAQIAIALVFLIALPLAQIGFGVTIWLKRRKR